MVVDMPTARVSALYARTGEAVPLAALAFLALVLFMGARGLPSSRGAA